MRAYEACLSATIHKLLAKWKLFPRPGRAELTLGQVARQRHPARSVVPMGDFKIAEAAPEPETPI